MFAAREVKDDQCMCGEKGPELPTWRMIFAFGGFDADEHEFPWHAGVSMDGQYRGGATIISPSYVLSAGHVVFWGRRSLLINRDDLQKLGVIFGSSDRGETQRKAVKSVKLHPNYKEVEASVNDISRVEYDFVLLELDSPLEFSRKIKPA